MIFLWIFFQEHLDKAIQFLPEEPFLYYLTGRYCYTVSWILLSINLIWIYYYCVIYVEWLIHSFIVLPNVYCRENDKINTYFMSFSFKYVIYRMLFHMCMCISFLTTFPFPLEAVTLSPLVLSQGVISHLHICALHLVHYSLFCGRTFFHPLECSKRKLCAH